MIDLETGEVVTPFIRTPYNYDTDAISNKTGLDCGPETKTQQQFKDEVDINTIVERFGVTGEMPEKFNFPTEQDFSETFDFQSAMNTIRQAQETFMSMPAELRARFNNDPQAFYAFTENKENLAEARKLGLLSPETMHRLDLEQKAANDLKEQEIIARHTAEQDKKAKAKN